MKILVADDEPHIQKFLKSLLESKGHKIYTAGDGLTALQTITDTQPDLMILDYKMPHSNGVEVLEGITDKDIKVIMISGYNVEKVEHEFKKSKNVIGFLGKPFDIGSIQMLLEEIENITQQSQL